MATKLPRFQITVEKEHLKLLDDVKKYLGLSKSKLFNSLIDQITPALNIQIDALKKIEKLKQNNELDGFDFDKYVQDTLGTTTDLVNKANESLSNLRTDLNKRENKNEK